MQCEKANRDESFQPTRPTLLAKACDSCEEVRRKAVSELVTIYREPLAIFLRVNGWKHGIHADDVHDILDSFIVDRCLERNVFARYKRRENIKFRCFLKRVLINYAINYINKQPDNEVPIGDLPLPDRQAGDPSEESDICWARRVVREALVVMETECFASDRSDLWVVFTERLAAPMLEEAPPTPYEELAARLNLATTDQVHNLLTTAKRRYERALRWVVEQYSCGKAAIDEEICELMRILAQANGRKGDSETASHAGEYR